MITKYRPQSTFAHPFNDLMSGFFGRDISQVFGNDDLPSSMPRVNITETPEKFVVSLRVPGFSKDELKISTEKDTLTIKGDKTTTQKDENERSLRREFHTASFARSFQLPETVKADAITAEHVDGVLNVSIPKAEPAKPVTREISIA
ncbi:MAG: Hsp20/alpha crystallin family protein [Flavobacteriales bacterium]|nr:Hsp20/alpha crystallin family protein [Flavobacteriales bacterium]HPF89813.1 Hsp20/alpha crystallin family protein [Flavobacteriales bacterium]